MGALLALARPGHRGNTGGGQTPPLTVPSVQHAGDVAVPKWTSQVHSAVKEGVRSEATERGGGGGKVYHLKDVQHLWTPP